MPKTYTGAGIGIRRMNDILLQLEDGPLTITDIMMDGPIGFDSVHKYLRQLADMGKITIQKIGRTKFYSAVPEVELIPEVFTEYVDRHLNKSSKPVGRPRKYPAKPDDPLPKNMGDWRPKQVTAPAAQVGIQRDPLVAALFGTTQAKMAA